MIPTANAEGAPIAPREFPVWLPSMLVKELRQALRANGFIAAFAIFQVAMATLMLTTLVLAMSADANSNRRIAQMAEMDGIFWLVVGVLLLGIVPLGGLIGLRSEIESRRIDLLVLTHLTSWRIVLGKWGSLMIQALLIVIAMLPFGLVRYFTGTVDFAHDLARCLLLALACAVLSAMAIWASSFGRILGLVLSAPVVLAQFGAGSALVQMTTSAGAARNLLAMEMLLPLALAGLLLLLFFLVSAVRQIAPAAEDYTALVRGIGLFSMAPVVFAAFRPGPPDVKMFTVLFALGFAAAICLVELASSRRPMAVHCRRFERLGFIRPLLAPFVLPGWQTGLTYALLLALFMMGAIAFSPFLGGATFDNIGWMIFQGLAALAFPAVAASLLSDQYTMGSRYFTILLGMSLLAALAVFLSEVLGDPAIVDLMAMLPVAGLLLAFERSNFGRGGDSLGFIFPFAIIMGTFAIGFLRTRSYWKQVERLSEKMSGREP